MTEQQINQFMALHQTKFRQSDLPQIKLFLEQVSELRFEEMLAAPFRSPTVMTIIAWLGGWLAIDRFMLRQNGTGVLKLITFGGCFWWIIIDILNAPNRTRKYNMELLEKLL